MNPWRRPYYGRCWTFDGALTANGYGESQPGPRYTHILVYETLVGPVSQGLELDHLCRNRACYNPAHLEPVPHRINVLRGASPCAVNAAKDLCVNGHPFDDANTYWRPDRPGSRQCIACTNEHKRIPGAVQNGDKTHCPRGHDFATHAYIRPDGTGKFCRTCANERRRARSAA